MSLLFLYTTPTFFGKIGTLFSLLYLGATITNFGFNASLGAFFSRITRTKSTYALFLLIHLGITIGISCVLLFSVMYTTGPFSAALYNNDTTMQPILLALVVTESLKRCFRMILQLAFQARLVALIEVSSLFCYTTYIWGCFFTGKQELTLVHIFTPLLIISSVSLLFLVYKIYFMYTQLPTFTTGTPDTYNWPMTKNRFFNFLNRMSHQLFSSNFLVPFFAATAGFATAGTLKLIGALFSAIQTILAKVFGMSGGVLLAHSKKILPTYNRTNRIDVPFFSTLNKKLFYTIAILFLFVFVLLVIASRTQKIFFTISPLLVYLIFAITLSESFFIAYEKLLTTHERSGQLFLFNSTTLLFLYITLHYICSGAPLFDLSLILGIRLVSLYIIRLYTHSQFNV